MNKKFDNVTDLKKEMMSSAIRVMTGSQSDLINDFERADQLAASDYDDWFFWGVRKQGTFTNETAFVFDESVKDYGEDNIIIKAVVGRHAKEGVYEITYSKHPDE